VSAYDNPPSKWEASEASAEAYKKGFEDGKPKWISVKDRLPKCFGTFIVAVTEPDKTAYTDSADYDPFLKTWKTSNYFAKGYEVTHWMPLPEPPKEVE
jgi:hypothetical protein